MSTLKSPFVATLKEINPTCHICCYGLYAALNADFLLKHGADSCLAGEYETPLMELVESLESGSAVDLRGVIRRELLTGKNFILVFPGNSFSKFIYKSIGFLYFFPS